MICVSGCERGHRAGPAASDCGATSVTLPPVGRMWEPVRPWRRRWRRIRRGPATPPAQCARRPADPGLRMMASERFLGYLRAHTEPLSGRAGGVAVGEPSSSSARRHRRLRTLGAADRVSRDRGRGHGDGPVPHGRAGRGRGTPTEHIGNRRYAPAKQAPAPREELRARPVVPCDLSSARGSLLWRA